jgi:hypothetical protein
MLPSISQTGLALHPQYKTCIPVIHIPTSPATADNEIEKRKREREKERERERVRV